MERTSFHVSVLKHTRNAHSCEPVSQGLSTWENQAAGPARHGIACADPQRRAKHDYADSDHGIMLSAWACLLCSSDL